MPGKPTRREKSYTDGRWNYRAVVYSIESRDKSFSFAYTKLPKGMKASLRGVIKGFAEAVGGTIRDEVATTYQGNKALDARITGANDKTTLFVRAILAKNRLYELRAFSGEGPDLKTAPPAYAQIVDSLKID